MKRTFLIYLIVTAACILGFSGVSHAQFKEEAFTQNYNDASDSTNVADSTDKLFSFKEWGRGLAHKQEIKIGTMFAGAMVLPGTGQIYNRQYWKLPIVYGTIGGFAGVGGYYRVQYNRSVKLHSQWEEADAQWQLEHAEWVSSGSGAPEPVRPSEPLVNTRARTLSTWMFVGAGVCYWASLFDCTFCYDRSRHPLPGRATIYSMLLPGLGQAYNGEYWKIPIYQGGLVACTYFLTTNNVNYKRFKHIHNLATSGGEYNERISAETAKYYRDVYRRYRDYSIVATALVYLLNVIDANVFAYMHDFEVSEDISLQLEPTVIAPDNAYAFSGRANVSDTALGLRFGLRF